MLKALESSQEAEVYYRYAQMLKAEGNMQESKSNKWLQFAKMQPNDARAKAFTNNPNVLTQLKQQRLYNIKKSDVSSDKADFGAQLTSNNEVYFAKRNTARKKNGMDEQPYLDLYKATRNTDGSLSQATEVEELKHQMARWSCGDYLRW